MVKRIAFIVSLVAMIFLATMLNAQQPQTKSAPLFAANAKYVNGVAPGYWVTCNGGPAVLPCGSRVGQIGTGTAQCPSGTIVTYAGGTHTFGTSTTTYVYLDTASSCAVSFNTTGFTSSTIPIATVVTSGSAITAITDDRSMFFQASGGGSSVQPFTTLTDGSTVTWDTSVSTNALLSLNHSTASRTLNLSNLSNGMIGNLVTNQDSTGGATLVLGSGCAQYVGPSGAGAIILTSSANAVDKLRFAYDGTNCYWDYVKNYTTSSNTQPNNVSGLQLWLAADCISISGGTCSTPANGTVLTSWQDQSSNANNGSISSGTCTFNTNQINGQPDVAFSSCHINLNLTIPWGGSVTMFAVLKDSSTAAKGSFFSGANNSLTYWTAATCSASAREQGLDRTSQQQEGCGTAGADTSYHQINLTYTCSGGCVAPSFRIDRATDTAINTAAGTPGSIGNGLGWNVNGNNENYPGNIAEFFLYNRVLTGTEITNLETYLNNKYGL